ncbi:DinB family protein [Streptantibioticus rubrisoli]|uniref:DinB family protein n=1 Tax=Streptantibioticus rubrisoli TaxID=1387313 RepID=A0ABT1PHT7_9ACTN|nr:DinB family protein [Streptantibioticus rubrisoli]MCQ4044932.1 DinB family protein [Streptantibioticus rubrisoli]
MPNLVDEVGDEREGLLTFLEAQRAGLRRAARGLTDEQVSATPTASSLSIGGLIKHNMEVERNWIVGTLDGRRDELPQRDQSNWADSFRLVEGERLAGVLKAYEAVARETEEIVRALPDLGVTVPLRMPWFPPDTKRSARWILLHLIEEVARHWGHADIIRETLDGKKSFELAES